MTADEAREYLIKNQESINILGFCNSNSIPRQSLRSFIKTGKSQNTDKIVAALKKLKDN